MGAVFSSKSKEAAGARSRSGGAAPHTNPAAPPHPRLTPVMSSRKLLALAFIKQYFARWGYSPTLGEIGAELGVSRTRAYDLVQKLAAEKMIDVVAGTARGIRLLERGEELSEGDVLVRLASLGWTIGVGDRVILPPLTEKGLPEVLDLDHDPQPADVVLRRVPEWDQAAGTGTHESTTFAGTQAGMGINGRKAEGGARGSAARASKAARRAAGGEQSGMGPAAS